MDGLYLVKFESDQRWLGWPGNSSLASFSFRDCPVGFLSHWGTHRLNSRDFLEGQTPFQTHPKGRYILFMDHSFWMALAMTQIFCRFHAFTQSMKNSDFNAKTLKLGKKTCLPRSHARFWMISRSHAHFSTFSRITHAGGFTQSRRNKIVFT